MAPSRKLLLIKALHTIVWIFFVGCIAGIPISASQGKLGLAAALIGLVCLEVIILIFNRWSCPLTAVAGRYTADRQANFDIFLPVWLARHNKTVFGTLFVAGAAYTAFKWWTLTPAA